MADSSIWSELPVELLYLIIRDTDDTPTLQSWSSVNKRFNGAANVRLWDETRISRESLLRITGYLPAHYEPEPLKQNPFAMIQANADRVAEQDGDDHSEHRTEPDQNTEDDADYITDDNTEQNTADNAGYGNDDDWVQAPSTDWNRFDGLQQEDDESEWKFPKNVEENEWFSREDCEGRSRRASEDSGFHASLGKSSGSANRCISSCHEDSHEDNVFIIGGIPSGEEGPLSNKVGGDGIGIEKPVGLSSQGHCLLRILHQTDRPLTVSLLPCIKRLTLDFQFRVFPGCEVASEDVAVSVGILLSHAINVEEIRHTGVLYQEILDLLTNIPKLKTLIVREAWVVSNCVQRDEAADIGYSWRPWSELQLNLRPIGQMHSLRALKVVGLLPNEGHSLAKAIGELNQLEELDISVVLHSSPAMWQFVGDGLFLMNSPLDDFLITMYGPSPWAGEEVEAPVNGIAFPAALKSLSLVDRDFQHTRLTSEYIGSRFRAIPSLTKLYINCLSINRGESIYLAQVLSPFMTHEISCLTIPICETLKYSNDDKDSQQDQLVEVLLPYKKSVQTWVFRADPDSESIDLPFRQKLERLWNPKETFRQLHTAVEPIEWYRETRYIRDHDLSTYLTGLGSDIREAAHCRPYIASWIPGLRHLKLESVDMNKLKIDLVDDVRFGLKELRVFISPSSRTLFDSYDRILPKAVSHHFSKLRLPQRARDFTEGRLASELAKQNLPCLRIIVFGDYQFWVERFPDNEAGPQLWYMHKAIIDPRQRKKMSECLDANDWDFLQNSPDYTLAEMEKTTLPERLVISRIKQECPDMEGRTA